MNYEAWHGVLFPLPIKTFFIWKQLAGSNMNIYTSICFLFTKDPNKK